MSNLLQRSAKNNFPFLKSRLKPRLFLSAVALILSWASWAPTSRANSGVQNQAVPSSNRQSEACEKILRYTFSIAKELLSYSKKAADAPLAKKIMHASGLSCEGSGQDQIIQVGLELLETQAPKIGVMGPLPDPKISFDHFLDGLKLSSSPGDYSRKFVVYRYGKTKESILEQLANLIFVERVGLIIGGQNSMEMESIEKYTKGLMIVLLGIGDSSPANNPWFFRVSPGSDILVDGILDGLVRAKAKKIAILAPETATDTLRDFEAGVLGREITISAKVTYKPRNFQSLDLAIQDLLKLSLKGREDEFKALIEKKQAEAELEKLTLNVENLRLPPIQDFDYLVVPDDFKMARHIMKILRFHGVTQVKLAGNHLWRSPNLVSPWDSFLSQSFFVDFIGSYLQLPFAIDPIPENPYFLPGALAAQVDSKLLGYRAGGIALRVLEFPDSRHRVWPRQLLKRPIEQRGFPTQIAFKEGRTAKWPIYLFTPTSSGITLSPSPGIQTKKTANSH